MGEWPRLQCDPGKTKYECLFAGSEKDKQQNPHFTQVFYLREKDVLGSVARFEPLH